MNWKMEKKTLNGLETHCVISANGAMRYASAEEVDLWADLLKLKAEKDELLEFLNKFGFRIEKIIKDKTGKGLQDDKVAVKLADTKAKTEEKKAKEADKPKEGEKNGKTEPSPGMGFGKRSDPPAVSESMAEKFKKKFGRWPSGYKPAEEKRA